jgi:hypothetical protein
MFPTAPRAQCVCGKIHLVDDNLLKTRSKRIRCSATSVCNLPRAIVIGIDAGQHLWHAPGRGDLNVGTAPALVLRYHAGGR